MNMKVTHATIIAEARTWLSMPYRYRTQTARAPGVAHNSAMN